MSEPAFKLSELVRQIEGVIHRSFGSQHYWVIAEVSGHKYYPNNDRHYLDLIEKVEGSNTETAKVKAKAWIEGSKSISRFEEATGQKFENGLSVLVKIKIEYHIVHGLSVTIYDIDPAFTLGNIARQRQHVLQTLLASEAEHIQLVDGEYITRNKRLKLPVVLQKIALIASPNSEGYIDFMHTLSENDHQYKFHVDIYHSSVQGKDAENELVNTFLKIHQTAIHYDCVVLIRGGGARTDFLVFDTYPLSRIVARFPIPVITGLGHHNDVSIVDMMAHTSTKTPTQSAEFIIGWNRRFESELVSMQHLVSIKAQQVLRRSFNSLNTVQNIVGNRASGIFKKYAESLVAIRHVLHVSSHRRLSSQSYRILQHQEELKARSNRLIYDSKAELHEYMIDLKSYTDRLIRNRSLNLGQLEVLMSYADPVRVLKRGFAIIKKDHKIISQSTSIAVHDELEIVMDDSTIKTLVTSKEKTNGNKAEL